MNTVLVESVNMTILHNLKIISSKQILFEDEDYFEKSENGTLEHGNLTVDSKLIMRCVFG